MFPIRQRKWPTAAFSLIELLVVVAVMGILSSTVIALSTDVWSRKQLNDVAVTFAGWLEEIAARAERTATSCTVTLENQATLAAGLTAGAQLAEVTPASCAPEPIFRIPESISTSTIAVGTSSGMDPASWIFRPRGTVSITNDIQLRMALPRMNVLRCVRISALFGQISLGRNEATNNTATPCNIFDVN